MVRPWQTLAQIETGDGPLELRRRGPGDYLITVAGRVLMNSRASRSEQALATLGCAAIGAAAPAPERAAALAGGAAAPPDGAAAPRVVIGGLGMGLTLRAALDALPATAAVTVCELHAPVADWCRGPLAEVNGDALADPRVEVVVGDVADHVRALAAGEAPGAGRTGVDAILLDLYEGPHAGTDAAADPFYGRRALERTRAALRPGGVFAIWSEAPDAAFERRLRAAGFADPVVHRPGRGGLRHAVVLARRPGP